MKNVESKTQITMRKGSNSALFRIISMCLAVAIPVMTIYVTGTDNVAKELFISKVQAEKNTFRLETINHAMAEIITENGNGLHSSSDIDADLTFTVQEKTDAYCPEENPNECVSDAELIVFGNTRFYFEVDSKFKIKAMDLTDNTIILELISGHAWISAGDSENVFVEFADNSAHLSPYGIIDINIEAKEIYISNIKRTTQISTAEGINTLLPYQSMVISEEENKIIYVPEGFADNSWYKTQMANERHGLYRLDTNAEQVDFSLGNSENFLSKWASFLIVSGKNKTKSQFADLDANLEKAKQQYLYGSNVVASKALTDFEELTKGADKDMLLAYLEENHKKLIRTHASTDINSADTLVELYPIRQKIEQIIIKNNPEKWIDYRQNDINIFEDLIMSFDTNGASGVLDAYTTEIQNNFYAPAQEDLAKQLLYLENLYTVLGDRYMNAELWEKLFLIEESLLSQLDEDLALQTSGDIMRQKIMQISKLWDSNPHYASQIAATLFSGYKMLNEEKYKYIPDHKDAVIQVSPKIQELFKNNTELISDAKSYKYGQGEQYRLTEEDILTEDMFNEWVSEKGSIPKSYNRPPTAAEITLELKNLGLGVNEENVQSMPAWVEFQNNSDLIVDTSGWTIQNSLGQVAYLPAKILQPKEFMFMRFDQKQFLLTSQNGYLNIFDADGNLIDDVNYPVIPKSQTYSIQDDGHYVINNATLQYENTPLICSADEDADTKNCLPRLEQDETKTGKVIISEISCFDPYRFHVANIKNGEYMFNSLIYDTALHVFSDVVGDTDTQEKINKVVSLKLANTSTDSSKKNLERYDIQQFINLPEIFSILEKNAEQLNEDSNISLTNLAILKNTIITQAGIHQVNINLETLCTEDNFDSEYNICQNISAYVTDPDRLASETIDFTMDYDIDTKLANNVYMDEEFIGNNISLDVLRRQLQDIYDYKESLIIAQETTSEALNRAGIRNARIVLLGDSLNRFSFSGGEVVVDNDRLIKVSGIYDIKKESLISLDSSDGRLIDRNVPVTGFRSFVEMIYNEK